MASLKEKIAEARAAGYSDDEIFAKLIASEKGKEALAAGYGEGEIREKFGLGAATEQDPNPVTRNAKIIGRGLVRGAARMGDLPGDLMELGNSLLPAEWHNPGIDSLLGSDGFSELVDKSGLVKFPEATPQNAGERLENSIATSVGASGPFLPAAPVAGLVAATGAGLGEFAANELMPGNAWVQLAAGIFGGMLGQSGVKSAEKLLAKKGILQELDDASLAWGDFEKNFPAVAATREAMRDGATKAAKVSHANQAAGIEASIVGREAGPRGALAGVSDALAPGHMGWEDAGLTLRAQADDWLKNRLPKELDSAWSPLDVKVAKDAPVSLRAFDSALDAINRRAGSAQPLVDVLTPSLPKILRDKMDGIIKGQIELGLPGFTWSDARTLRTALGDAMRDPKVLASMGDQNVKRLYAALTEDLGQTAAKSGAKKEFEAANVASRELFEIAEGPVAKVLADGVAPGQMAKGLVSRGVTDSGDLAILRRVAPSGVDALGAVGIRFGENGTMLSDWAKLSPKAKEALVPDAKARAAIDSSIFSLDNIGRVVKSEKLGAAALRDHTTQVAKDDFANWKTQTEQQKLALKARLKAAEERAASLSSGADLASEVRAIKNLGIGAAASYGLEALGVNADSLANSKVGALLAVGVPVATHGVKAVAKDPGLLRGPTIGVAAANALMPPESAYNDDPMRAQP